MGAAVLANSTATGGVVHSGVESVGRVSMTWMVLVLYGYCRLLVAGARKGDRVRSRQEAATDSCQIG
jgi:hypothetical protein